MTRDMRPDELESFEEDIVQGGSTGRLWPEADTREQSEIARESVNDKDEDGLPDEPAKYRVPS